MRELTVFACFNRGTETVIYILIFWREIRLMLRDSRVLPTMQTGKLQ